MRHFHDYQNCCPPYVYLHLEHMRPGHYQTGLLLQDLLPGHLREKGQPSRCPCMQSSTANCMQERPEQQWRSAWLPQQLCADM